LLHVQLLRRQHRLRLTSVCRRISASCGAGGFDTGAFLGAGSVVAPDVSIGANAVVGAGAVVVTDVPERAVVVGNPARVLRYGDGYGDVGVPVAASRDCA
jgi:acetyltransferase-like isoleucine patch superfamily enzyme